MSKIHAKLNRARTEFHRRSIKKTGRNTFSKYDYFELSDFLVPALSIFADIGLCAVVSFAADIATMTVTDTEDGSSFAITSPMSTAELKATHAVQQLGAVQTYLRRYLWVALLEIVEHDALESDEAASSRNSPDRAAWIAEQRSLIERAKSSGELKLIMADALAITDREGDQDAAKILRDAAEAKMSAAHRAASNA